MSWLEKQESSNIQTALQSQAIQSNLEKNSQGLSDQAFNSYLTNSPIPRFYNNSFTSTFTSGADTTVTYAANASQSFDPYGMLAVATGIVTIPRDGFYQWLFNIVGSGGTAGFVFTRIIDTAGAQIGVTLSTPSLAAGGAFDFTVVALKPHRAGDTVRVKLNNSSGGLYTPSEGSFGGVWVAPFNQYAQSGGAQ